MEFTSDSHGIHMEFTWNSHRTHIELTSESHGIHIGLTWNSHRTHIELTSDSRGIHIGLTQNSHRIHRHVSSERFFLSGFLTREFGANFSERISGLPSGSHRSAQILRTSPKLERCAGSVPTLERCAGSERLSLYNYEGGGRAQGEAEEGEAEGNLQSGSPRDSNTTALARTRRFASPARTNERADLPVEHLAPQTPTHFFQPPILFGTQRSIIE